MTTTETRDRWIDDTATMLDDQLGVGRFGPGRGYSPEGCRDIAAAMHDLSFGVPERGQPAERQLLAVLLRAQGVDDITASALAQAWHRVDWALLFVGTTTVGDLFGESTVSVLRNVIEARLRAEIAENRKHRERSGLKIALAQALAWVAWRRTRPQTPGAGVSFPPE